MSAVADLEWKAGERSAALETLSQLLSLARRGGRTELAAATLDRARSMAVDEDPAAQAILLTMEADALSAQPFRYGADNRERMLAAADMAARAIDVFAQTEVGRGSHRVALATLQRACSLEDAGRGEQALPLLDEAVASFEAAKDPINGGSALQRRGNCLASVGRHADALDSYARSAALFHELGTVDYRSNSLGEAGLLLADAPGVACPARITAEMIVGGIDDIADRSGKALASVEVPGRDWPSVLTRKACGIIALASLSAHAEILPYLAARLHDVADPLLDREPDGGENIHRVSLVTAHFGGLAWLADDLARIEVSAAPILLSEVEAIAVLLEGMLRGWMRDAMFRWLARYLAERHGLQGLSSGVIRAAVDGLAYDEPFELPGFDQPDA